MMVFTWVRTGLSPLNYELLCDGRPVGTLAWLRGPRTAALAETAGRILVLRRKGLLRQQIVVETISEEVVARGSLPPLGKVGYLHSTDGKRYNFRLSDTLEWLDSRGEVLARIPLSEEDVPTGAIVDDAYTGRPVPLILMFVGWYIHLSCRKIVLEPMTAVSAVS